MNPLPNEKQLYDLYYEFNKIFFNNKLPDVKIRWDHISLRPGVCLTTSHSNGYIEYEIVLSWKYHLLKDNELVITLKHEMLHIIYPEHDENFQKEAERIGTKVFAQPIEIPTGRYKYKCSKCENTFYYDSINILLYCNICYQNGRGNRNILDFIGMRTWSYKFINSKINIMPE